MDGHISRGFDFFKHISTLSFTAMGFAAAIRASTLPLPRPELFHPVLFCYSVAMMGSLVAMLLYVGPMAGWDQPNTKANVAFSLGVFASIVMFALGTWNLARAVGIW
jgi:hypothetical protein